MENPRGHVSPPSSVQVVRRVHLMHHHVDIIPSDYHKDIQWEAGRQGPKNATRDSEESKQMRAEFARTHAETAPRPVFSIAAHHVPSKVKANPIIASFFIITGHGDSLACYAMLVRRSNFQKKENCHAPVIASPKIALKKLP
ncbi:hypothetical protein HNY73_006601 [Argiope bruennichi]|uniref:Uncharacterized protein n=1 Tax=Argiope bruennichi TaxID=94029 RepID=A0A8T0FIB7_ARGBR|nr:hypothetical protein HNY73_006601 [Argiope bruennichi]